MRTVVESAVRSPNNATVCLKEMLTGWAKWTANPGTMALNQSCICSVTRGERLLDLMLLAGSWQWSGISTCSSFVSVMGRSTQIILYILALHGVMLVAVNHTSTLRWVTDRSVSAGQTAATDALTETPLPQSTGTQTVGGDKKLGAKEEALKEEEDMNTLRCRVRILWLP